MAISGGGILTASNPDVGILVQSNASDAALTIENADVTTKIGEQISVSVTGVTLNVTGLILQEKGSDNLIATVEPDNATNQTVAWISSDTGIATVDNGVVTAVAAGTATITVTTEDGNYTEDCTVIVTHGNMTLTLQKDATCTSQGKLAYYTCETCGKYFSDAYGNTEIDLADTVIPATAHKLTKTEAKAATCTEDGNKEYWTCDTCGKIFSDAEGKTEIDLTDTVISKLGHSYGDPVWNWAEDGKSCTVMFICANDRSHGETPKVTVSSKVRTPATCTEKGVTEYTAVAEFNGKTFTATKEVTDIDQAAHNYIDGKCTVCGAADPDYQRPEKPAENNTVFKQEDTAEAVQTGDTANPAAWIFLFAVSAIVFAGAVVFRKKKEY